MAESLTLGQEGEKFAVEHLKNSGFKILRTNWKWGRHEIDIIAENKEFVIFVEVKTRSEDFRMHPVTAITREKKRTMIWAADGYIKAYKIDKECRFDVITLIKKEEGFEIDHIEDAFYPTLR